MFSDADEARETIRGLADELCAQIANLKHRQGELLATIVRLTRETPYDDEAAAWPEQRARLVASVGTMRARLAEARELANWIGRLARSSWLPSAVRDDLRAVHDKLRYITNEEVTNDGNQG